MQIDNPRIPFVGSVPALSPNTLVQIIGIPSPTVSRFSITLQVGPNVNPRDDVALHIAAVFQGNTSSVLRNSIIGGQWGIEESCGHFPFLADQQFEIMIFCDKDHFKIAVNDLHFAEFHYRMQLDRVAVIAIDGDVSVSSVIVQQQGANTSGATSPVVGTFWNRSRQRLAALVNSIRGSSRIDAAQLVYPPTGFESALLNALHRYVTGCDANQAPLTFDELMRAMHGGAEPSPLPKVQLSEFRVETFIQCILSNALEIEKTSEQSIAIGDIRQLLDIFLKMLAIGSRATAIGDSERLLKLQFALTICVHLSKTVGAASARDYTSQIAWFLNEVVCKYFYDADGAVSLPFVLRAAPKAFSKLWSHSFLQQNLAAFFAPLRVPPAVAPEWTQPKISMHLSRMQIVFCDTDTDFGGFTWLNGIVINLASRPVKDSFIKAHFLSTHCHETSHHLMRKIVANGDLNHSSPGNMAFELLNSDADVEADESRSTFVEFGYESATGLFGGVLNFTSLRKPQMASEVATVCRSLYQKLVKSPLTFSALPLPPILSAKEQRVLLNAGIMMNAEDAGHLAKFGMLYMPRPQLYL